VIISAMWRWSSMHRPRCTLRNCTQMYEYPLYKDDISLNVILLFYLFIYFIIYYYYYYFYFIII
jgi:hypothetical protein